MTINEEAFNAALARLEAAIDRIEESSARVLMSLAEITDDDFEEAFEATTPSLQAAYYLRNTANNGRHHPDGVSNPYELTATQLMVSVDDEDEITNAMGYYPDGSSVPSRFVGPYTHTFSLPRGVDSLSFEVNGVETAVHLLPGWVLDWSLS